MRNNKLGATEDVSPSLTLMGDKKEFDCVSLSFVPGCWGN